MDEIREQMDIANEISDAISQPLGGEAFDEDDLLSELEELEQESLDEQLLGLETTQPTKMPTAPSKGKKIQQKTIIYKYSTCWQATCKNIYSG